MNLYRILLITFFCCAITGINAQKNTIKKANKLYKLNQYNEAIDLYESALEEDDNLSVSTKLAYCYKMTNKTEKAENWYAKVVKYEKAKPITYYYYGEALMGNGKYDLAKAWFMKYNELVPDDKNVARMIYACDKVKTLEPYFPHVKVTAFEFNSAADESSPIAHNNGIVFTSDRPNGINPLKQKSGWTGRDYQRIYFSEEKANGKYRQPQSFSKKLNELNKHCGPVTFTKDKKTAIFTRTGQNTGRNNAYNIQLYSAESDDGVKWKKVEILPFCNKEHNYMHPAISPDGQKLFFISDKPGGVGGTDIYVSEKKGDSWSRPKNLGLIINTPSNEAFPFFHESGKLFFSSKGHLSYGGFDILFSHLKEDNTWQKPVNVGQPINSSYDDISFYLNEVMDKGFFASSRANGNDDIYILNILEGTNTALDTLDFEMIANEGPEIEGLGREEISRKSPKTNSEPLAANSNTKEEFVSNPEIMNEAVTERNEQTPTNKVIENNESVIVNTSITESNLIEKETLPLTASEDQQVLDIIKEETSNESPVYSEAAPNRKEETPTQTKEKINKNVSNLVIETKTITKELKEHEALQEAQKSDNHDLPNPEKFQKERTPKPVNLMIPAKKKEVEKKEVEKKITHQIVEAGKTEPEEKISTEVKEESAANPQNPITEKTTSIPNSKEIPNNSPITTGAPVSPDADRILDNSSSDVSPPVLIGDKKSMIVEAPLDLSALAEALKSGKELPKKGFIVSGINYPSGSYLLSPESTRSLAAVIDLMIMNPDLKIEIGSHTSSFGNDVENHNISRKRAMSIQAFLVYKGISNNRIIPKGYGETQLINHCANGVKCSGKEHNQNDRIEIKVIE